MFRKSLTILCAAGIAGVLSAAEPGLLLYSNFDKYNTTPDYHASKTIGVGGIAKDLQLRMFPNIKGDGNSVCMNNKERVTYSLAKNFRPDRGSVSLWINLQNWDLSDTKYFHSFFEVSSAPSKYRMVVYKYRDRKNAIVFYLQSGSRSCTVVAAATDWKKDTWHKVDAVWNEKEMKLYVDAKLVSINQTKKLPADMVLPKTVKGTLIALNSQVGWRHNPAWVTAYDDLKIYDRCLTADEIGKEYDKYFPRNFEINIKPGKATIPYSAKAVKIDGKMDKNEWNNATAIPIVNHLNTSQCHHVATAKAMLQYSKTHLYLAFQADAPAYRHKVTKKDGELWNDDSVEFHVFGTDGKKRQFIFNANGAVYDSLAGKADWDSGATAAGSYTKNSWCVEVALPLTALGGKIGKDTVIKGNFGYSNWKDRTNNNTWNYVYGYLKGYISEEFFGELIFGSANDAVRFVSFGTPAQASLELKLQGGKDLRGKGEWLAETGAGGKSSGDLLKNTWKVTLPSCRNIIRYTVRNAAGREIYRAENFVQVQEPFNMTYSARASKNLLLVDFAVNKVSGAKNGKIRLFDPQGKMLAEKAFRMTGETQQVTFPLPAGLKENTTYSLEGSLGDFNRKMNFRMPDMTPFKTRVGIDDSVPVPWQKVVVKGKTYTAGSRTYTFDKGPMPVNMTVDGKTVLSTPPALLLNGKAVTWDAVKPGKNYGDRAEFTTSGKLDAIQFTCRGEVWFDGMYRWDLTMTPPENGVDIESLNLTWSMPADASNYIMNPYYVPWKNGRASLKWTVDERASLLWLTGQKRGLAWWCQSDANWVIDPNRSQIYLRKEGGKASIRIEMIQDKAVLKKPASYTMVFQATPPRKLTMDYREWQYHAWRSGATNCGISGWNGSAGIKDASNILHYTTLLPAHPADFGKHFQRWKKKGVMDLVYSMPAHIGRLSPEYDYFYPEWAVTPGVKWGAKDEFTGERYYVEPCCGKTQGGDLQAYRADKLFRDYPEVGGIYFDICHVLSCYNDLHGCGGIDAFGKKFRSSTALALREYFLRIYKLTRKYNRALWLHAHNAYYPFVHDFADLWLPGEEQYFPVLRNPEGHYFHGISKEEYQSALNPAVRGVGIMMIAQNARVMGNSPELLKQKERFIGKKNIDRLLTVLYLHDLNLMAFRSGIEKTTLFPFWDIRRKLHFNQAEFTGYWMDQAVKSKVRGVYVSRYSWKTPMPYSVLLAIGNWNKDAAKVDLQIEWKKLGLDPQAKWYDPLTDKELDRNTLSVPGEGFLLIAIK